MCPFSGVPNEILELIVVNVDAPRDLRALAFVCRSLRRVISPRHLEYREVTITSGDSAVWVHLAQRPDLARNVRRLTLQQWSEPESRLPTTLVATHAAKACAECPRVRAVRNMVNLSTVVVNGWKTSLAYLLRYCPHELKDVFLNDPDVPLAPNHPIWAMRGLRKLAIPNMDHQLVKNAGQRLVNFISRSAQLEVLDLPAIGVSEQLAEGFSKCRVPRLRELSMGAGWNDTTKTYGAQFLAAHPFLKSLTWRITFSTDSLDIDGCDPFLPRLQALTTNSSSLLALVVRSQHTPRLRTVHFRGERPLLWTLPLTLRHLSVPEADLAELRKLAHACPALRRLDVGGLGLSKARWRWADIAPWIRMGGPGNVRASVSDALVLFPELRIIGGTRFSSDMRRTKLLERFPRVERFDDLKRASYYWEL